MSKPTIYMTVGIPGCGKSIWAETHKDELNAVVHSSDAIRLEMGDINDQSKNNKVFQILHKRIKDDLKVGKNVIMDCTGLNRRNRIAFLNELNRISCSKTCVLFATPFEFCLANNFARERHVPEDAMCRMYKRFQTPWFSEGFDDIQIVWWNYRGLMGFEYDVNEDIEHWKKLSHDNLHHSLSIGDHMLAAYEYIKDKTEDKKLIAAALLHDCGKPDTKAFVDSKGNHTNGIAHYYNHESCGAFKSLFYLKSMYPEWSDKDILYVSLLINLHMRPFLAYKNSEKAREKDRRLFGDEIMSHLMLLHEADLYAH